MWYYYYYHFKFYYYYVSYNDNVKIADIIIPNIDVLRFSVINGIGMLLFIGSLYIGRLTTDSKKIWFYNGFTAAGLILIIYSSFYGDIMGGNARVCHSSCTCSRGSISRVCVKYDEQEKF